MTTKTFRSKSSEGYQYEDLVTEDGMQYLDYITRKPPVLDGNGRLAEDFHLQTCVFREIWHVGASPPVSPKAREIQMEEHRIQREQQRKEAEKGNGQMPTSLRMPTGKTKKQREPRPAADPNGDLKALYRQRFMVAWKADGNVAGDHVAKFKTDWKAERAAAKGTNDESA